MNVSRLLFSLALVASILTPSLSAMRRGHGGPIRGGRVLRSRDRVEPYDTDVPKLQRELHRLKNKLDTVEFGRAQSDLEFVLHKKRTGTSFKRLNRITRQHGISIDALRGLIAAHDARLGTHNAQLVAHTTRLDALEHDIQEVIAQQRISQEQIRESGTAITQFKEVLTDLSQRTTGLEEHRTHVDECLATLTTLNAEQVRLAAAMQMLQEQIQTAPTNPALAAALHDVQVAQQALSTRVDALLQPTHVDVPHVGVKEGLCIGGKVAITMVADTLLLAGVNMIPGVGQVLTPFVSLMLPALNRTLENLMDRAIRRTTSVDPLATQVPTILAVAVPLAATLTSGIMHGHDGRDGRDGARGERGETGVGTVGPVGPMGPQGERGLTGERGETGETGPMGAVGPRGLPGPIGPRGETGATGPQGVTPTDLEKRLGSLEGWTRRITAGRYNPLGFILGRPAVE